MTNREEVAKKLRESGKWLDSGDTASIREALFLIDQNVEAPNCREFAPLFDRLADLIDPTCRIYYTDTSINTPDTGYEPDGYYSCSCCGELDDRFAEMWDDYQARDYEGEPPFEYCPHCGARAVRDDD